MAVGRMALVVCVVVAEDGLACRLGSGAGKRSSQCRQRRGCVVSPVPAPRGPAWGLLFEKSTPSPRK